ncbi:GntR family transcriptional regulator [Thermovirga sp.]|uniref:GntR family transcriptional regulator n=1 Tax=Thermovirga sp. TaxID=2699834 RepID=UPI0025F92EBD|nr:GntR family transcriptional regulator [Thermovirga sp.]MBO8154041.1 GntR family transcriptional regulator [Thermovirga sp.]
MDSILKAIPEETYVPVRVIVYETLREAIFRRELKDGDKLIESELAEKLNVSRTPVREALRMLESEGLVERIPRKGLFVKGLSKEDIIEIYSIRQALEALAIRSVCKNITDEELKELKRLYSQMEEAYEQGDDNKLFALSQKFNEAIVAPSNMPRLLSLLATYHEYLRRLRSRSFSKSSRKVQALKEHGQILEAISERNPDKAERLVKEHLENAIKALTIEFHPNNTPQKKMI